MSVRFVLTGDKKLDRIFTQLPRKVQSKILREELKREAKKIQVDAKMRAPKDRGDLSRGIVVRAGRRRRNMISRAVLTDPRRIPRTGDDQSTDRTAGAFQEFGTENQRAQPFMRPAFDKNKATIITNFRNAVKRRILALAK